MSKITNMQASPNATEMLGRVIEPLGRCFTSSSAREILSLKADESAVHRIGELASKCGAGTLTPQEEAEYQVFIEVGDLVAILQAKARRFLSEQPA
ncbi:MAG TPA: hypothetical protein VGO67_21510 [Verrucomicrobiae bacterium]